MCTVTSKSRITADELTTMPDEKRYELIEGELVERPPAGNESSWIAMYLGSLLFNHCLANRLGWVFDSESGYQCFPGDPNRVRKPDVSFVRFGRLPNEQIPKGYAKLAPDLAVEVVSPNDLAEEVESKVSQFLAAGVRLVWVVYPETRSVRVHRVDRSIAGLLADEELTGEDVAPGFRRRVGDLFPPPAGPTAPSA